MTEKQMCDAFEHCDPARYQEFYNAVRVLAADQGTRLYWARVKGGEPDDE